MDKDSKMQYSRMSQYLKNYYSGIGEGEYQRSYDNYSKITEKIRYSQELQDVFEYAPKFKEYQKREKEKKDKLEYEQRRRELIRLRELADLEKGQCSLCLTRHSFKFYDIDKEGEIVKICHECAKQARPELITRTHLEEQLLHKRGKVPVHLQSLKEKLKEKKFNKQADKEKKREDNLTKQEQEQLQQKEEEEDIKICYTIGCEKQNEVENLLNCKSCERTFHSTCSEPQLEYNLVKRFDWFCTICKLCILCWKSGKEEELLICDCCDRAYHMGCRKPKILKIPEGRWFCPDCEKCASCKKPLLTNENFCKELLEKFSTQHIDQKIICDTCWVFYQDTAYCPVCYCIIESDAEGNYVWCDVCELWIHFECEKIPQKQIQQIQQLLCYTCQRCRELQQKEDKKKHLEEKLGEDLKPQTTTTHPIHQQQQQKQSEGEQIKKEVENQEEEKNSNASHNNNNNNCNGNKLKRHNEKEISEYEEISNELDSQEMKIEQQQISK